MRVGADLRKRAGMMGCLILEGVREKRGEERLEKEYEGRGRIGERQSGGTRGRCDCMLITVARGNYRAWGCKGICVRRVWGIRKFVRGNLWRPNPNQSFDGRECRFKVITL